MDAARLHGDLLLTLFADYILAIGIVVDYVIVIVEGADRGHPARPVPAGRGREGRGKPSTCWTGHRHHAGADVRVYFERLSGPGSPVNTATAQFALAIPVTAHQTAQSTRADPPEADPVRALATASHAAREAQPVCVVASTGVMAGSTRRWYTAIGAGCLYGSGLMVLLGAQ